LWRGGHCPLLLGNSDRKSENGLNFHQGEVQETFVLRKGGELLQQAAQGGGSVAVPGGVQETWSCDTKEHSLVGSIGSR